MIFEIYETDSFLVISQSQRDCELSPICKPPQKDATIPL